MSAVWRAAAAALLAAAVVTPPAHAGGPGYKPLVLGGAPQQPPTPTVALLDRAGKLVCSGVLLSPRLVLTAAHCFGGKPAREVVDTICVGASTHACAQSSKIEAERIHPRFTYGSFDHDLAALWASEALSASYASLATSLVVQPGDEAEVEGFGRAEPTDPGSSGDKRVRPVLVERVFDERVRLGESVCRGDSGGGAYRGAGGQRLLIGIHSSGPPGCEPYNDATRVDRELAFIEGAMAAPDAGEQGCGVPAAGAPAGGGLVALAGLLVGGSRRRGAGGRKMRPRAGGGLTRLTKM